MNLSASDVIIGIVCLVVGWFAHVGFDALTDWWYETTGNVAGFLWDLFAICGIVALCGAVAAYWAFG